MVKCPKPPRAEKNPELCYPSEFLTSVYLLENFPISSSFSLPYCSQVLHRSWTMQGLLWASGLPFPRNPALRSSLLLLTQFCEQILWRTTQRPGLMNDIQVTPSSQQPFTQSLFKGEITSLIEKERDCQSLEETAMSIAGRLGISERAGVQARGRRDSFAPSRLSSQSSLFRITGQKTTIHLSITYF